MRASTAFIESGGHFDEWILALPAEEPGFTTSIEVYPACETHAGPAIVAPSGLQRRSGDTLVPEQCLIDMRNVRIMVVTPTTPTSAVKRATASVQLVHVTTAIYEVKCAQAAGESAVCCARWWLDPSA